jgi:hypothetical protein
MVSHRAGPFATQIVQEEFSGTLKTSELVDELGVVGAYRVRLHSKKDGRVLRETWSGTDGRYTFTRLAGSVGATDLYYAAAFDHSGDPLKNAAISDQLILEAM